MAAFNAEPLRGTIERQIRACPGSRCGRRGRLYVHKDYRVIAEYRTTSANGTESPPDPLRFSRTRSRSAVGGSGELVRFSRPGTFCAAAIRAPEVREGRIRSAAVSGPEHRRGARRRAARSRREAGERQLRRIASACSQSTHGVRPVGLRRSQQYDRAGGDLPVLLPKPAHRPRVSR